MSINDILQCGAVAVLLIYCVLWIIRRIRHRKANCVCSETDNNEKCSKRSKRSQTDCPDCPLASHCHSRQRKGES